MATVVIPAQPSFVGCMLNKIGFDKELPSRKRPADFTSDDFKPGGQKRLKFKAPAIKEGNVGILMDDSGSMKGDFWWVVRLLLAIIVDAIQQNDKDGLDWWWLNEETLEEGDSESGMAGTGHSKVQNPNYIAKLFDNRHPTMLDGTPTGARLQLILEFYINTYKDRKARDLETDPFVLIVWTDGHASDKVLVEETLVWAATQLDELDAPEEQLGIQLLQVGDDEGVARWLKKLDDDLKKKYGCRDIVDTKSYEDIIKEGGFTELTLLAIVLGPIVQRLDDLKSALDNVRQNRLL